MATDRKHSDCPFCHGVGVCQNMFHADIPATDPARDCPPCPSCGLELGTPIIRETMIERWDGPRDATLLCPSCGTGWVGTPAEYERALASWRAYEREMAEQSSERRNNGAAVRPGG